jgi:hypothetical protein
MKRVVLFPLLLLAACTDRRVDAISEVGAPDPITAEPSIDVATIDPAQGAARPLPAIELIKPLPVIFAPSVAADPAGAIKLADVGAITVHVVVKNAGGPHEVSVEFVAPGEINYQRKAVTIDGPVDQEKIVDFELPVAGTMITQQKLSGVWSARLFLDGAPMSTPTFELTP